MRGLSRDLWEQINSIKRELDSLEDLWVVRSREELKKKIFFLNESFYLLSEFKNIFLKSYDPTEKIKDFFKGKSALELIIVNEDVRYKLTDPGKSILDIFLIWEIDKDDFNSFLAGTFFNRKVKYAIISTEDFYNRLNYWDKLVHNIITQKGNIFLRDTLKIQEKMKVK